MIGRYRLTILILVERQEDITVSELKRILHEPVADTKADVTLRRLCDAGLIDRYGSPYRYYMTSDGRAYLSELRALLTAVTTEGEPVAQSPIANCPQP